MEGLDLETAIVLKQKDGGLMWRSNNIYFRASVTLVVCVLTRCHGSTLLLGQVVRAMDEA